MYVIILGPLVSAPCVDMLCYDYYDRYFGGSEDGSYPCNDGITELNSI